MRAFTTAICTLIVALVSGGPISAALDSPAGLFDDGKKLLDSGEYDKAAEAFSKVLNLLDPNSRNAHVVRLARAQAHLRRGALKESFKDVDRIVQSDGADGEMIASALRLRGMINRRENREKQALEDFTRALRVSHENDVLRAECFASRGVSFINLGQPDKAVSDLNKAIELHPDSGFAYAARALAFLRLDKIETARRDAEHALSLNPDEETRKVAKKVLSEMAVLATGPQEVSVPLSQAGHVYVHLRFSKHGNPHRFLLDTGASVTLIHRELLDQIKEETEVKEVGKTVINIADGSTHKVTVYRVKTAFLFSMPLGTIEVMVLDKSNRRIVNLLGTGSMKNIIVSIDNARRVATISRADTE